MRNIKTLAIVASLLTSASTSAEVVSERKIGFQSVYEDGTVENMVLKYSAIADLDYHNTGSASKGISHLQDTRHCVWDAYAFIQRDICTATRTAGEICEGKYTKIFNDGRKGDTKDESQNILKGKLDAVTCGDVMDRINSNYAQIKANVTSQLKPVMDKDIDGLFDTLQKAAGVKRVVRE